MSTVEKFSRATELLNLTILKHKQKREQLQQEYETDVLNSWKKKYPKSKAKFITLKKRQWNFVDPIFKRWKEKAKISSKIYFDQTERIHKILDILAKDYPLVESKNVWRRIFSIDSGTYSTQGFGAEKYTRNHAEQDADRIRYTNLPVHIRTHVWEWERSAHDRWAPNSITYFEVWAPVETEEQVDVLTRKPGPSLKEWIRLCWKRGVNPRVYNPFLPYGLEEKLGLDYFGNQTQKIY